jgi:hypothetical protein
VKLVETLVAHGESVLTGLHCFALVFTLVCTRCARGTSVSARGPGTFVSVASQPQLIGMD